VSDAIETHLIQKYTDGIRILAQQDMSRFTSKVDYRTDLDGKVTFIDQAGRTSMARKSGRHVTVDPVEFELFRRRVAHETFYSDNNVSRTDIRKVLNDHTGALGRMQAMAMGRNTDQVVTDAALATAYTGETGSTSTAFPTSTHQIVHGSVGLSTAKCINAKRILDENEVSKMSRYAMCTAEQLTTDLLNDAQARDGDFNTIRALVRGEINTWLGFEFDQFEGLAKASGSTTRKCLFWQRESLLLSIRDVFVRVSELPQMHYDWQVYLSYDVGATRTDEYGVVEVQCTETDTAP